MFYATNTTTNSIIMKEEDLFNKFVSILKPKEESLLLEGQLPNCSGAVINKNCVVRKFNEGGSAVRTVERGALVQVWSYYDEVRFSVVIEDTLQVDPDCLLCKLADITLIPGSLWGALLPLSPEIRLALTSDARGTERLAAVGVGCTVELLDHSEHVVGYGTVMYKNSVQGLKLGLYYGIQILGKAESRAVIAREVSVLPQDSDSLPTGCDAVVTLQQLRPARPDFSAALQKTSLHLNLTDHQPPRLPKSISQHSLRACEEAAARRQASRSLDLTAHCSSKNADLPTSKLPLTSRSLDIPKPTTKRLARGRACSSLDSEGSASRFRDSEREQEESSEDDIGVGSLVELLMHGEPYYGVIRWVGRLSDAPRIMAGVEMEEELEISEPIDTMGLFDCPPYKALFVPLHRCHRDPRFQEVARRRPPPSVNSFGQMDCPVVEGTVRPIAVDLHEICGKNRGIQGHHNSCYLDATLFSMFAFTSVFDSLLYRPPTKGDIPEYLEVQRVLRDEIVNPLRRNLYVRADRVMKLRTLLERLSSVTGLTSEEKDPEEFLNSLLAQILKAEPFLQLSSGQEAFHYQLFVEKDERLTVPSVQQLLEQSFLASDIKLKQLPPCLIIQMPRFGKAFKMYPRILPPTILDVTDVIENSPRQCFVCGELAELECRDCFLQGLEGGSFCRLCLEKAHSHPSRSRHIARPLQVPLEFRELQEHCAVPRLSMHLFAVVCIETSHYVAFINTDRGWVFFDSMADRKGEQNGYNIPEIVLCPDLPFWLSDEGAKTLGEMRDEKQLPELAKRLLCDAYMCMYQSPEVMMYR